MQDQRGRELLKYLDDLPDEGLMSREEIEKFLDLVRIYERKYLEGFIVQHPDFPAAAAIKFNEMYVDGPCPYINDIEQITIPCQIREYQESEWWMSVLLTGCGCSERLISEFLKRDRTTVRKYLHPIRQELEASTHLDKEVRKERLEKVVTGIHTGFIERAAQRASQEPS